jgi:hypothetical protein
MWKKKLFFVQNPIIMAGFEPTSFCPGGGRDDHHAAPPWLKEKYRKESVLGLGRA